MSDVLFLLFTPGSMTNMNKLLSPSSSLAQYYPTSLFCSLFLWSPLLTHPHCPKGKINAIFFFPFGSNLCAFLFFTPLLGFPPTGVNSSVAAQSSP